MQNQFIEYVFLILIILALVIIANKLKIAYPIVLVLGGLLLSFTSVFNHDGNTSESLSIFSFSTVSAIAMFPVIPRIGRT